MFDVGCCVLGVDDVIINVKCDGGMGGILPLGGIKFVRDIKGKFMT